MHHAASISSAQMPAEAIAKRWRERSSFQLSPVSVYGIGHITSSATPMWPTRTPWRVETSAWPISCSTFENTSAAAKPTTPSQLSAPRRLASTTSSWRAASAMPASAASAVRPTNHRLKSHCIQGSRRASQCAGRTSGIRMNR